MKFILSLPAALPGWDKNKRFVNFGPKPVTFESKGALRKYCKEKNVQSAALL